MRPFEISGELAFEYESPNGRRIRLSIPAKLAAWAIAAAVAIAGLTVTLPAYAVPPDDTPAAQRPDDRGDDNGQGRGQGSSRGNSLGQGRGNGTTTTTGPRPLTGSPNQPGPVVPSSTSTTVPVTTPSTVVDWPPSSGDPLPPTFVVPIEPEPGAPRTLYVCVA